MKDNIESEQYSRNLADDPEFIKACREALQDPEKKEQIICILQRAESTQSSDRRLA